MIVLPFLLGIFLLVGAGAGWWLLFTAGGRKAEISQLQRRLDVLEQALAGAQARPEAPRPEPELELEPEPEGELPPPPPPPPPRPEPEPVGLQAGPPLSEVLQPVFGTGGWRGVEESLTSRWLVWLGGVALALGGVFLVKYSIDRGWLGPGMRVTLGLLFGVALVVAGEAARQRWTARLAQVAPDYVPAALSGAGLFSAFASVYAAYGLYHLIGPLVAFALLAAIALAGIGLALLQGPFLALLGLVGGYATPILVATGEPRAFALFSYVLTLTVAGQAIVRYRGWWWLGWAGLAGASLWAVLWFGGLWQPGDAPALALFLHLRAGGAGRDAVVTAAEGWGRLDQPERLAWAAALAVAAFAFMLVRDDGYGWASLGALVALTLLYGNSAWREPGFDGLIVVAAVAVLASVAAWHLPAIMGRWPLFYTVEGAPAGIVHGPLVPPELRWFLGWSVGFAALFAGGGFVGLWRAARPGLWAAISGAMPLGLLIVVYWRVARFEVDLGWAATALVLAGLGVVAAQRVGEQRARPGLELALAAYAAAAVGAISLAATMALEQAWLTVALALQLPALAVISARLSLPALRGIALIIATLILARLSLNPFILDYPIGGSLGFNWVAYGYGLPALAFAYATRRFRAQADDRLVAVLEAGTLIFAVQLVSFEFRTLIEGRLDSANYTLAEQSLQTMSWLAVGYGLVRAERRASRPVRYWGWRMLLTLASAQVLFGHLLLSNPLWSDEAMAGVPLVNLLLLAYGLPALFAVLFAKAARDSGQRQWALAGATAALALVFVNVSLEVRRWFHGPVLTGGTTGDGEWYGYSLAWLAYGAVLLAIGLRFNQIGARYAALAVLLVTVAKVFLSDMAALTGLYRVASFVGLGLSLVAVGHLYRRYVMPSAPPAPSPPTDANA